MPQISVIIPSYNSKQTIERCLRCLHQQSISIAYEIIVVDSSDDGTEIIVQQHFPNIHLIHLDKKTIPGEGRNIGAQHAKGEVLAFTDADCMPSDDWLSNIWNNIQSNINIIGGSVENGRPESMISRAEYYIEFREFSKTSKKRKIRFLPSCNFAIKRDIFEKSGGFPDVRASEDVLFAHKLSKQNYSIWFDPEISIKHLNRNRLQPYLSNQYILGKYSAVVRKILPMPSGFLVKIPYAFPLLPMIRTIRTIQFICHGSFRNAVKQLLDFLLIYPIFFLGTVYWSYGFFKGAKLDARIDLHDKDE
jgi:glycosyltransferase involved in cell wall biosynthesis